MNKNTRHNIKNPDNIRLNTALFDEIKRKHRYRLMDIALGIGLSANTVSSWYNGIKIPFRNNRKALAAFLNVRVDDLFIPNDKEPYITQDMLAYQSTTQKAEEYNEMPIKATLKYLLALSAFEAYLCSNRQLYNTKLLNYYINLVAQERKIITKMTFKDDVNDPTEKELDLELEHIFATNQTEDQQQNEASEKNI